MQTLQNDNKSEFPHIETRALWVGELRKKYGEDFTNTHEDDCFNFVFANATNNRLPKDDFFELVEKRIAYGEARLFPECSELKCEPVENLKEKGLQGEMYKRLNNLQKELELIKERFSTNKQALKIYTDPEKEAIQKLGQKIKEEQSRIKRDLKVSEEAPSLFGFDDFKITLKDFDFSKILRRLAHLKLSKADVLDCFLSTHSVAIPYKYSNETFIVGFSKKMQAIGFSITFDNNSYLLKEIEILPEKLFKKSYCYG